MPWYVALFWLITAALTLSAWCYAEWPERTLSTAMFAAAVVTRVVVKAFDIHFDRFPWQVVIIDTAMLGLFLFVALRSDRWWTICATALYAPSLLAHVGWLLNPDLRRSGYSVAGLTTYAILPAVAVGIYGSWRRRKTRLSLPPSWRRAAPNRRT